MGNSEELPTCPQGCVRVVCISDTHNVHSDLRLPRGDVSVHAGDCLTESGTRYVDRRDGVIRSVSPDGVALFENFARWIAGQDFPLKVFIAGNHDLVMQGLGKDEVRRILAACTPHGCTVPVYLEHEEVNVS